MYARPCKTFCASFLSFGKLKAKECNDVSESEPRLSSFRFALG
jgi:hypothetical protein